VHGCKEKKTRAPIFLAGAAGCKIARLLLDIEVTKKERERKILKVSH